MLLNFLTTLTTQITYTMPIITKQLTYTHPDKEALFHDISFSVEKGDKVAIVGNNGVGKSTLLKVIAGESFPSSGEVILSGQPYYVPQHFGQYSRLTIAQALKIDRKLDALHAILAGDASAENFTILDDDWTIEERALGALSLWGLDYVALSQPMESLSGGEKTRVFLSGIAVHDPQIILMDEPTNHLDFAVRDKLYNLIESSGATIVVVSHDRILLSKLSSIYELRKDEIVYYPGNYEFYKEQKEIEINSLQARLEDKEKELRLARKTAREAAERKQKHEVRGKKQNIKKGVGKMAMDTLQDKAEKSASKLKDVHRGKMDSIAGDIAGLQAAIPDLKAMKTDFGESSLHTGKILVSAKDVNYAYGDKPLWNKPLNFTIKSGDRIAIKGNNGSGKTTLLKLVTGKLLPTEGAMVRADFSYVYLDQEYSIIDDRLTVFEQAEQFAHGMCDYEIKSILNRFLFTHDMWDKQCSRLSGGEKMKLALCCLMLSADTPDMFILDEPTNNIDIQNIGILTATVRDYKGTVVVVSHDGYFVDEIGAEINYEL